MGNLQAIFPEDRHAYVIAASSEDPLYPATNAQTPERQMVPWHATSTSGQWLRADLFASRTIAGVDLRNVSATGYVVETSADALAWTTRATGTLTANTWTLRYQGVIAFTPVSARYVRVTFSGVLGGATFVSCAGLSVLGIITTTDQNFGALSVDARQRMTVLEDLEQSNVEGEMAVAYRFGKEHWHRATGNTLTTLRRLRRLGNSSVLLHENNGDPAESYLCRLAQASDFRISFRTVAAEMIFHELV